MRISADKNTLAYHLEGRPLTTPLRMYDVPAEHVGLAAKQYLENTHPVSPEKEALRFYLGEHILATLRSKRSIHEPLSNPELMLINSVYRENNDVFLRLFYYVLVICVRESRHLQNPQKVEDAAPPELKSAMKFIRSVPDDAHNAMRVFLDNCPKGLTVGTVAKAMQFAFYKPGHWAHSYGGKKWGAITDALVAVVEGKFSPAMFCDVSWALEHNGGCMFNKGMFYGGYTETLKVILDVQRAGQIPRFIASGEAPKKYTTNEMHQMLGYATSTLQHEDYIGVVDWDAVAKFGLGNKAMYKAKVADKEKQKQTANAVLLASLLKANVTYFPDKTMQLTTRENFVKIKEMAAKKEIAL